MEKTEKTMTLAVIILNFNDASRTIEAVKRIHGFRSVDHIVVLDNASRDDSLKRLKYGLSDGFYKLTLLKNKKNGGYGYGNNWGVKYAFKELSDDLVLIANPDSIWDEDLMISMMSVFEKYPNAAAVGAVMLDERNLNYFYKTGYNINKKSNPKIKMSSKINPGSKNGHKYGARLSHEELKRSGWMYRPFLKELLHGGPLSGRLFSIFLDYPKKYYDSFKLLVPVYAVHGSLVMFSTHKFLRVKGYDESMFLYGEENALAYKFKNAGYETYLVKKAYIHTGSHSIIRAGLDSVTRQKIRQKSELVYFRNYLKARRSALLFAKLFQLIVLVETKLWMRYGP